MIKAILISIRPEHAVNILNGNKTLELRKTVPKGFKGWVYIYVSKPRKKFRVLSQVFYDDYLYKSRSGKYVCDTNFELWELGYKNPKDYELNGKVVARFWFDEYDEVEITKITRTVTDRLTIKIKVVEKYNYELSDLMLNKLCLTQQQVLDYGKGQDLYAWHIKDLEIFKEPMELYDCYTKHEHEHLSSYYKGVKRPPQSWQYVYVEGERK